MGTYKLDQSTANFHKGDVQVGHTYLMKVGAVLRHVQVTGRYSALRHSRTAYGHYQTVAYTYWLGTNLATGKEVRINSAAKLRQEIV